MSKFTRSEDESIDELARATGNYVMVPAKNVGRFFRDGWRPVSPMIAMEPPVSLDGYGLGLNKFEEP
jgi:hypothetical protein